MAKAIAKAKLRARHHANASRDNAKLVREVLPSSAWGLFLFVRYDLREFPASLPQDHVAWAKAQRHLHDPDTPTLQYARPPPGVFSSSSILPSCSFPL